MCVKTPSDPPPGFQAVLTAIQSLDWRKEVSVSEIGAPQRIAPYSVAMIAEVVTKGIEVATGRLIVLHDPAGNDAWDGLYRCVAFARADVEPDMIADPLLSEVGWSWLLDALAGRGARFGSPSGTVTGMWSQPFGEISTEAAKAEMEIRASWTPLFEKPQEIRDHCLTWQDVLCTMGGMPPEPVGVTPLVRLRR